MRQRFSAPMCVRAFSRYERRRAVTSSMGFLMCLFLAALMCCAFSCVQPPAPVVLTAASDGTVVTVARGTQITVRLADNSGSTGYTWSFLTLGKPVLDLQSTKYVLPAFVPGTPPRIGASGVIVFTFVAQNSGNAPLKFVLKRPWETNIAPAQSFGVVIHVTA